MNVPSLVRKGHDLALQLLRRMEFVPALLTRLIVGFAFFDSGSGKLANICLLYTSPSPRDRTRSRMPSSA